MLEGINADPIRFRMDMQHIGRFQGGKHHEAGDTYPDCYTDDTNKLGAEQVERTAIKRARRMCPSACFQER